MKTRMLLGVLAIMGAAPAAWAQPGTTPTGDEEPVDDLDPPDTLRPAEPPPPAPPPPPPPPRAASPASPAESPAPAPPLGAGRPHGFSIGIGLGYDLPANLQAPDITGVRIRLGSGLTFEPQVTLGRSASSFDGGGGTDSESSTLELELATNVRWPRQIRGPVDLVLAAGLGFGITGTNPDGDDNNSSTTTIGLNWGFGLEYWVRSHWCVSLTAMNPLVAVSTTSQDQGPDVSTSSSTNTVGLIFDPNVTVMLHLFL